MLRELHITNLAVIADARIELGPGLNAFTGATGAGKSLVIGAVELLLGMRSPAEMLRTGADEARVSGLFEVLSPDLIARIEAACDVPLAADAGQLLLTRRMHASGRSSIAVNGHPITLAMLRQIAELLIDIHGQHDHQYLLKPANQLDVLDHFAGNTQPRGTLEKYRAVWADLSAARQRLADLAASDALRTQQLDLHRFQADEIDAASIRQGEFDELSARAAVLRNMEKIRRDATTINAALYEAEGAVLERLKTVNLLLAELAIVDPSLADVATASRDAAIALEEAAFDVQRYLNRLDHDPAEAGEIDARLNVLNRLLSKYGPTETDLLAFRADLAAKITTLEQETSDAAELAKRIAPLQKQAATLAAELTKKRAAAAAKLAPLVHRELAELGMEKARFDPAISPAPDAPGPFGNDAVDFLVQPNPGQAFAPLRKIASGGELSRIMLALKGILAQSDRVSVLVFDEIDSNVGARLGDMLGRKLRRLANHQQVLCITHLPQIAAFATRHITVRKETDGTQTRTTIRQVQGQARIEEIAEMIGGTKRTQTTLRQAEELLAEGAAERHVAERHGSTALTAGEGTKAQRHEGAESKSTPRPRHSANPRKK